ncbi:hypothetical protein IMZ48_17640 [Candidatus Bathyarchaeota archaeon]|nr:hypothetical protein [Candidatus Bathyarchaeota archaeon]
MASVITMPTPTPPPQVMPPKVSMTTKEWIVPPRPKPGRKPATDTPPTKRKAQNRAAQRAFRERRAARVGELEEQMDEYKDERDKTERELKDKIHALELDLQSFRSKCSLLENLLDRERQDRIRVESEAESLRRRQDVAASGNHYQANGFHRSRHSVSYVEPRHEQFNDNRSPPRKTTQSLAISQIISPPDHTDPLPDTTGLTCGSCQPDGPCACAEEALQSVQTAGCGNCGPGMGCQCLDEVLNTSEAPPPPKRALSPSNPVPSGKRMRPAPQEPPAAIEMDFTHAFKKSSTTQPFTGERYQVPADAMPRVTVPPQDSCGFCTEGSYCACADTTLSSTSMGDPNTLPSLVLQEGQAHSPPPEPETLPSPMEITSTGAVKIRPRQKLPNSPVSTPRCGPGGPGTCAQCIADPQSGLFCRSLAAINDSKGGGGGGGGGCCGGAGPGGGCCKSGKGTAQPIGISCADTYKTLSSHRNFDQAFEEIGTWLPKLKVVERPGERDEGRAGEDDEDEEEEARKAAVDIDAASIMTTLKFLDVRFRKNRQ